MIAAAVTAFVAGYIIGAVIGAVIVLHVRGRIAEDEARTLGNGLSAALDDYLDADRRAAVAELRLANLELWLAEHGVVL